MESKKLLIICAVIVAIVLACAAAFCYVSMNEVKYTNEKFDGFSMTVPEGSDFEKVDLAAYGQESYVSDGLDYAKRVAYKNKGNYSDNLSGIAVVTTSISSNWDEMMSIEEESDPQVDALMDYLFTGNSKFLGDHEYIVNESSIIIVKTNSTNPIYEGLVLKGNKKNFSGYAIVGGNDLDIVKNATYSFKFN